jgi:hypothetical protein
MNDNTRRGPGLGLLLLIPIGLLIAKGVGRRRAMLAAEAGAAGHHGFGHRFGPRGFGPRGFDGEGTNTFSLPPKIERVLDGWHERVHAAREINPAAATTDTATA